MAGFVGIGGRTGAALTARGGGRWRRSDLGLGGGGLTSGAFQAEAGSKAWGLRAHAGA